jgi:predicted RNA binding protein YcfA (HicA-like mRNA interferase family)
MRSKDLIKKAQKLGLEEKRSKGSHRVYYFAPLNETVLISVKNGKDMNPNTYRSIERQLTAIKAVIGN